MKMPIDARESNLEYGRVLTRAEIEALVREAERMRREYLGELLAKLGHFIVKSGRRLLGLLHTGLLLLLGQPVSRPRHSL